MTEDTERNVPGMDERFHWLGEPTSFEVGATTMTIVAGARTDWFIDPDSTEATSSAPALVFEATPDFTLAARVEPRFASSFDAGALVVWHSDATWAKLAFEFSPQGQAMVVSVVTRGHSDDCNSVVLDTDAVWLRIARLGNAYAFHFSHNAREWHFVRYFRLHEGSDAAVGFEAQSPLGSGCLVRFSDLSYSTERLSDLRSGI